jgi:hypothetical protein
MDNLSKQKIEYKEVLRVFGKPQEEIREYLDENNKSHVDILKCADLPYDDVNSYATLGIIASEPLMTSNGQGLIAEITGACDKQYDLFPNILSTCAFEIINSRHRYNPGAVFENVVAMYYPKFEMKHILLVTPFLWEETFNTLDIAGVYVAWLQMIPISEKEFEFAKKYGSDKLEDLFEARQIDLFDLERRSVC